MHTAFGLIIWLISVTSIPVLNVRGTDIVVSRLVENEQKSMDNTNQESSDWTNSKISVIRTKRQASDSMMDPPPDSSGEDPIGPNREFLGTGMGTSGTNPNNGLGSRDPFDTETNVRSLNKTSSDLPKWWDRIDTETSPCNSQTHEGCDIQNSKRCSGDGVCACLSGYALNREHTSCIAAQYFRGEVRLFIDLTQWLNGTITEEGQATLKEQFRRAILTVLHQENVDSLLDVRMIDIEERSGVIVTFEIVLDKTTSPRLEGLQETYRFAIMSNLVPNAGGSYVIRGTSLVFAPFRANLTEIVESLSLTDYNHCLDPEHNYCDHNAACTNRMGTFVCRCRVGYTDLSPDTRTSPGETCAPTCGCQNNGTCVVSSELVSCRCPQWFLGEKCEIDGKMLLIVLCSVLGGLLLLTMIFCFICVCAFKKKARRAKRSTAATVSSIDSTLIKLPRPWMDTSRSYEAPTRDLRRWSYVSEPIRYADELFIPPSQMIDDHYHSETLPLPHAYDQTRRQMASYQNPVYHSETLPARPSYQMQKYRF